MYIQKWQMCYDCAKSLGGCSWSDRFEPVEGWQAEKTHIARACGKSREPTESYDIFLCPEFEPDKPIAAESLDTDGCVKLLCAIFREASKEYIEALKYCDKTAKKYGVFSGGYMQAENRLKLAEKALTPEICKQLQSNYYKRMRGENNG